MIVTPPDTASNLPDQLVASIEVNSLHASLSADFALTIPAFRLRQGEMTAVIGPNGSGKTTLLSFLLGVRRASEAKLSLLDDSPQQLSRATRLRLGVQMQHAGYNDLYLVRDIMQMHQSLYPITRTDVFAAFQIEELLKKRYGSLSSGQQQRLQLAMALAHSPDLAIFDEPTSNLDPHFEQIFCGLLQQQATANPQFSCLFITHSPRMVSICDRILFLRAGKIEHHGSKQSLVNDLFGSFACAFNGTPEVLTQVEMAFKGAQGLRKQNMRGETLTYYGDASLKPIAIAAAAQADLQLFTMWTPGAADLLESIKHV